MQKENVSFFIKYPLINVNLLKDYWTIADVSVTKSLKPCCHLSECILQLSFVLHLKYVCELKKSAL